MDGQTMKVTGQVPTKISDKPKKASAEDIKARIKAKFGDKVLDKDKPKKKVVDTVELKSKSGVKNSSQKEFGDLRSNNPNDSLTHDKIKHVMKSGAFKFSQEERDTLAKILK